MFCYIKLKLFHMPECYNHKLRHNETRFLSASKRQRF